MRLTVPYIIASLAEAQEREGAITDALETVEQGLQANPKELLFYRPEALRLRGELRRKTGQPELAEADFRESIALAHKDERESVEAASDDEPRADARTAGPLRRSAREARRDLRLGD